MDREHQDWRARRARQSVSLTGTGTWPDGTSAVILLSNISYDGCHLWTDHELCAGEVVELTVPAKGRIEGQVRWVRGGRAGVRFLAGAAVAEARRARLGV